MILPNKRPEPAMQVATKAMIPRYRAIFAAAEIMRHGISMLGLVALSAALASPVHGMTVTIGKTVEITSSKRYCWYPTVHRLSTGEILVTMRMSPDEVHPEGEFSAYCVSRDGGATWSQRYTMGAGANVDAAYTQEPPRDGTLLSLGAGYGSLIPCPAGQARVFRVALTRYSRGGMEAVQVRDAVMNLGASARLEPTTLFDLNSKDTSLLEEAPSVTPFGAIVEGLNGDLLTTVYYTPEKGGREVIVARSSDRGMTWSACGVIAAITAGEKPPGWMGDELPNETAFVRLADQRLYAIIRTGSEALLGQSWSSDDGRTWTQPHSVGFKGVDPHLRRLGNGFLVLTTGRPGPVSLRVDVGGRGESWSPPTEISKGKSTCYSDLIELEPGTLLVVHDSVPYGWNPIPPADKAAKNAILGTFVELREN